MSRPVLHHGDVLEWARSYDGEPFHALLCDPPYHLTEVSATTINVGQSKNTQARSETEKRMRKGFMGKQWDGGDLAFRPETWAAFLPLLYPGAFCMAFASSRGWHRMAVAIEDAGFLLHPTLWLYWSYGSGFPKATRIDTQIDAAAGAEREVIGPNPNARQTSGHINIVKKNGHGNIEAPATDLARAWAGHRYGRQAIKPAVEPIIVFQKPFAGRPVDSMVATGAGALWIDGARIGMAEGDQKGEFGPHKPQHLGVETTTGVYGDKFARAEADQTKGRWPANLLLHHHELCQRRGERRVRAGVWDAQPINSTPGSNGKTMGTGWRNEAGDRPAFVDADGYETIQAWDCHADCAVRRLGKQSGESRGTDRIRLNHADAGAIRFTSAPNGVRESFGFADSGTAARFFFQSEWMAERLEAADPVIYKAKSSTAEREAGLSGRQRQIVNDGRETSIDNPYQRGDTLRLNTHATIKPLKLCQHLATLLLPPALYAPRRLFIPFAGVASEVIGAMFAGWEHIDGIELEREHVDIGTARLAWWQRMMAQTHSTDLDAILKRYGGVDRPKPPAEDSWPAGSLFADLDDTDLGEP